MKNNSFFEALFNFARPAWGKICITVCKRSAAYGSRDAQPCVSTNPAKIKHNYCIALVLLTGILAGCAHTTDRDKLVRFQEANIRLENELTFIKETEKIGVEIFRRTVRYENTRIENSLVYWGKDTIHTVRLKDVAAKAKLVFCFSTNTCQPCVEANIEWLKEQFPDFETNETVLIAGDYPLRLRGDCYGKRMLGGISLPLAEIEAPFFFVLDGSLTLSYLHIYNKSRPELTKVYLTEIKSKLSEL